MEKNKDIRENLEIFAGRCPPSTVMENTEDFVFSIDEAAVQAS